MEHSLNGYLAANGPTKDLTLTVIGCGSQTPTAHPPLPPLNARILTTLQVPSERPS